MVAVPGHLFEPAPHVPDYDLMPVAVVSLAAWHLPGGPGAPLPLDDDLEPIEGAEEQIARHAESADAIGAAAVLRRVVAGFTAQLRPGGELHSLVAGDEEASADLAVYGQALESINALSAMAAARVQQQIDEPRHDEEIPGFEQDGAY